MKRFFIFFAVSAFYFTAAYSQSHISMQSHQNAVTAIAALEIGSAAYENSYFSAGQDGFLIKWTEDGAGEHYQLSDLEIRFAARSPNGTDIAVYETDGGLVNRVSVWNWSTLTRKYAKRFSNAVTSLSFSEKGTYLIVGTATVNGVVFLNASTGSQVTGKLKDSVGIITMASSSSTENSIALYSPAGSLSYFNLRTGRQKARFQIMQGLNQPVLFNNNVFFAGTDNKNIYIIQATTGKDALKVPAINPLLLCSRFDRDLYYLENDGKSYVLKVLENLDNNTVSSPKIVKKISRLPGNDMIVTGAKAGNEIVLGSQNGNIYKIDADSIPVTNQISFYPLTDNMYDKIYDIAQTGEDFYFLTRNAVFKSSYDNSIVEKTATNAGQTNIISYQNNLILWSRGTRRTVQLISLSDGSSKDLYTPKNNMQSLRIFGSLLVDIEGNTSVNKYNLDTSSFEELYSGTSLQDAVLFDENSLYVAKSSATNPASPLIFVDTTTKETVPITLSANVAYSLNYDKDNNNGIMYGISVSEDENTVKTQLFSFKPETKTVSAILQLNDEDPDAFVMLFDPFIYTNIGKNQILSYNLNTKTQFHYKRSASLPLKIARNKDRLVVLNRDGSISWYNPALATVLTDWYMTNEGQWYEF